MALLRLETFEPESSGMAETAKQAAAVRAARDEGYREGFAAGAAASADDHMRDQSQLRAQFVEAIRDAELGHHAARHEVLSSLLNVLETLVLQLAENLADASLPGTVRNLIEAAFQKAPGAELRLRCAIELKDTLEAALENSGLSVSVLPDARLTPLEAELAWDDGFERVDFDAALTELRALLAALRGAEPSAKAQEIANAG